MECLIFARSIYLEIPKFSMDFRHKIELMNQIKPIKFIQ